MIGRFGMKRFLFNGTIHSFATTSLLFAENPPVVPFVRLMRTKNGKYSDREPHILFVVSTFYSQNSFEMLNQT
jgi:hypothetical protein